MRSILICIAILTFQVNCLKSQAFEEQEHFLGQNQLECEEESIADTKILIPAIQLASSNNFEFYSHKWVNLICWGFLIDFGIIIVRLGKISSNWIEYHALFMGILVLSSAVVEFEMIIQTDIPQNLETNPNVEDIHGTIGFIFLGLIAVQCLGGIFLRFSICQSEIINNLKLRSRFHCYGGHLIYLIGKIEAVLGVYTIYNKSNDPALIITMWCLYFFLFFWRIIVESLYAKGYLNFLLFTQRDFKENINNKSASVDLFTGYVSTHGITLYISDTNMLEAEFNTKTWVLLNNSIINLTGLVHPGGQFIWKAVKGREVSRFIYGAYGLENSEIPAYNHSQYALDMIKFLTIGTINPIPFYIFEGNESELFGQSEKREKWLLKSIDKLSEKVSKFEFAHQNIQIRSTLSGLNAMGRYFLLQSTNSSLPIRPYTMVLCMADESKLFREQLIKFLDSQEEPLEMTPKLSNLPLLIKKYDTNNGFSQYVHTHPNEEYYIEGPYGTSLGLPEHGKIVLVCGGTGLFPVLDLLDYFLKKTVYELLLQQHGQKVAQKSNANGYDFSNTLHLTLFLAVADESELIGKDIYMNLLKFQKQLQQPMFRMILKIRKPIQDVECVTERFNEAFFQKHLNNVTEYVRFIVCGPPFMNREVPQILQSLGVFESNIHLL